jgi:hypothetical protein
LCFLCTLPNADKIGVVVVLPVYSSSFNQAVPRISGVFGFRYPDGGYSWTLPALKKDFFKGSLRFFVSIWLEA